MKNYLPILISNFLLKLDLQIINKKIYHKSFFVKESGRLINHIAQQYNQLVSCYPTEEDQRKAEENKILFINMLYWLGLHSQPCCKILDLGGRGGLFAYYCGCYGHDAYVSDLPRVLDGNPNKELLELFKVKSIPIEIKPFTPIYTNGIKFDLITGFRTRFHSKLPFETGKDIEEHWGVPEWDFFLKDLSLNILTKEGRIFFMLNRLQEREKVDFVPVELVEYFHSIGGRLRQQYLLFQNTAKIIAKSK